MGVPGPDHIKALKAGLELILVSTIEIDFDGIYNRSV